eukprot:CAMPEP_0178498674 /NCGR_PEP_ID=MMETSP0696-20121128/15388_1 /TAXON_ID=265572 /ORGANISM="Extubocellulus spinifer, Strain CCMP396" /LENGTH=109 /DNA_ID=CAMNT_0020127263 /DNA_START=615 /DNA_END=944 /DNA_ORIENTATION=+
MSRLASAHVEVGVSACRGWRQRMSRLASAHVEVGVSACRGWRQRMSRLASAHVEVGNTDHAFGNVGQYLLFRPGSNQSAVADITFERAVILQEEGTRLARTTPFRGDKY